VKIQNYVTSEKSPTSDYIWVTLNKEMFKSFSINTSELMSKNTNNDRDEYSVVIHQILNKKLPKKELWNLVKKMLQSAQDEWQEKMIKSVYKTITKTSWKPYVEEGYSDEDYAD